jgi:hypothetical protein
MLSKRPLKSFFFKSSKSKIGLEIRFPDFTGGQFLGSSQEMLKVETQKDGPPPAVPPAPVNGFATTKTGVVPPIRPPNTVSSSTWHLPTTAPATTATRNFLTPFWIHLH